MFLNLSELDLEYLLNGRVGVVQKIAIALNDPVEAIMIPSIWIML